MLIITNHSETAIPLPSSYYKLGPKDSTSVPLDHIKSWAKHYVVFELLISSGTLQLNDWDKKTSLEFLNKLHHEL